MSLDEVCKSLFKSLKEELRYTKTDKNKIKALDTYKLGFDFGIESKKEDYTGVDEEYKQYYNLGYYQGEQFNSLENDYAKKFFYEKIEKLKQKYSKPNWLERIVIFINS
jgi:hypothetical protein